MMSQIQELRNVFHGLETLYSTYLPKVDPILLNDLLLRELTGMGASHESRRKHRK
jgi:hypothetical protein